jgi:hypothetical protein
MFEVAMKRETAHFPIGPWILWIVSLLLAALAAILFILFVAKQNDIRCFNGNGVSTQPTPTPGGGLHIGRLIFHSDSAEIRIVWSGPTPTRISLRGPLYPPNLLPTGPYALTLCGGNTTKSCEEVEMATCLLRDFTAPCGVIETQLKSIDATDIELTPLHFFNITGFLKKAKEFPELFYVSVEIDSVEVQRGQLGATCSDDVL